MSYFILKYTDKLAEGFGGEACGPLIKIRPKYASDDGLLEHEKVHVRQWYFVVIVALVVVALLALLVSTSLLVLVGSTPFVHGLMYRYIRRYRQSCEVEAYKRQIAVGGYISTNFASTALAEKYKLGLSLSQAKSLLMS